MKKYKLKISLIIVIFFTNFRLSYSSKFKEIDTKYFRIIFDENLKEYAYHLYRTADEITENVANIVGGFNSKDKIIVRVIDDQEENAYVRNSVITMYPNAIKNPAFSSERGNHIDVTFAHEVTHLILNSKIFLFPYNLSFIPRWLHEGCAVYIESKLYGARGANNYFTNIPSSFDNLEFSKFNISVGNSYYLGYDFINCMVNKYGEKESFNRITEACSKGNIPFIFLMLLKNKDNNILKEWKNSRTKTPLIGERVLNIKVDRLGTYKNGLFYENEGYFYRLETSSISSYMIMAQKYFFYDDIYIKYLNKNEKCTPTYLVAYDKSKYLNFKNPTIIKRFKNSYIYVSRQFGKESLILDDKTLISEDFKFIFIDIIPVNNRLFFIAKDNDKPNNWLFEIIDNKIFKLFQTDYASIFNNTLYCQKENTIFQFDTNKNIIEDILVAKNIYSVNRVKNYIYFLMFDEGIKYIHKLPLPSPYNSRKVYPQIFVKPIYNSLNYYNKDRFKYKNYNSSLKFDLISSLENSSILSSPQISLEFFDELDFNNIKILFTFKRVKLSIGNLFIGTEILYNFKEPIEKAFRISIPSQLIPKISVIPGFDLSLMSSINLNPYIIFKSNSKDIAEFSFYINTNIYFNNICELNLNSYLFKINLHELSATHTIKCNVLDIFFINARISDLKIIDENSLTFADSFFLIHKEKVFKNAFTKSLSISLQKNIEIPVKAYFTEEKSIGIKNIKIGAFVESIFTDSQDRLSLFGGTYIEATMQIMHTLLLPLRIYLFSFNIF
jgi:hypothetical protein